MRKLLILMAGGVLGFLAKTVIDEIREKSTVNTTTGQEGQRVPPFILAAMDEAESVKPDADF